MSIGLEELSDDQLVELLNEACIELAVRDPIVRKLAQGCIGNIGSLLPDIRKLVKNMIDALNEEELDEEEPYQRPRARNRRNPPRPSPGPTMPSSFNMPVPQNPPQNPLGVKKVSIVAPVGYRDIETNLESLLHRALSKRVLLSRTNSPHIFHVILTPSELGVIKGNAMFAQFHIVEI